MSAPHCPITGVNIPRFIATVLAGFVFIFGFSYIVHNQILMDLYEQTSDLWRTQADMESKLPFMFGTYFATALVTAFIFTRNYQGTGAMEGVRYGCMLGALLAVLMSASYAWSPIPLILAIYWACAGLIEGLGLGILYALIYRK